MEETKNETFDVAVLTTYELAQKMYPNEDFSRFKDVADSFDALLNAETFDVTGPRRLELEGVSGRFCVALCARAQTAPTVRRVVAVGEPDFGGDSTDGLDETASATVAKTILKREAAKEIETDQAGIEGNVKIWRAFRRWLPEVVVESAEDGRKNVSFVLLGIGESQTEGEGDEE